MTAYVARIGNLYEVLVDVDVTDTLCRHNEELYLHWVSRNLPQFIRSDLP